MKTPFIPANWIQNNNGNEKASAVSTLVKSPAEITLSDNLSIFEFSPKLTGQAAKERGFLQVGVYVPVGETITVISPVASVVMTASTTPGANEFYTESVAPTAANLPAYLELVTETIADTLNQNLSIYNNYTVQILGSTLYIESNLNSTFFAFSTFQTSTTSINMFTQAGANEFLSQSYIDYTAFTNIFIGDELFGSVVDRNQSEFVTSKILDVNTKDAAIDASVVANYLTHILPYKSFGLPYFQATELERGEDRILRPYFLEYGDRFSYVENQAKKSFTKGVSPIRWQQLGAEDYLLPYIMASRVWNPATPQGWTWLTDTPNDKVVTPESHEFLQTIVRSGSIGGLYNIRITTTFLDGTQLVTDRTKFSHEDLAGNVSFDVSPVALDLKGIERSEGKVIDKYTVQLVWDVNGQTTGSSQLKSYKMDDSCTREKTNIIFVNKFGAWDSLEFRGERQEELEREVLTLDRGLPSNANTLDSVSTEVKINIETNVNSVFTLNTGLLQGDHIGWSKSLEESSAVYIWLPEYGKYRSILIRETNYINDSTLTGQNLEVKYSYGVENNTIRR